MHATTRNLLAAALLTALSTGLASAANVELYGKVETSMRYMHISEGSVNKFEMLNEGSRWGLNIKEDLGDGLSVKGYLESGFNSDDGALTNTGGGSSSAMLFDRRAVLALRSETMGEIGFGRMGSVRSTMSPYSLGLAWLDPFETGYGSDSSISTVFGNDPSGNNTITYVSPKMNGLRAGLTYSLQTSGQENASERLNNRLISAAMTYENGPVFISLGATQQWTPRSSSTLAKSGAAAAKKLAGAPDDAQAYTLGATLQATPEWKLFAALQYQEGWRSVAGWSANSTVYTDSEGFSGRITQEEGVKGVSALAGFQWKITGSLRMLGSYMYFDGEQNVLTGEDETKKLEGSRHIATAGLEYKLSKKTRVFTVLSYSKAQDDLEDMADSTGGLTRTMFRAGMQHWF